MRKTGLFWGSLAATAMVLAMGNSPVDARHQAVLALQPVGYWPADEGSGEVLHDRSGSGNHGRIFSAGWNGGFLNFTGVSQWAEIPSVSKYNSAAISIGGWVNNRGVYDTTGVYLIGNGYRNTGITLDTLYDGKPVPDFGTPSDGVSLTLPKNSISILCGNQNDAVGSVAKRIFLDVNEWEHVLFTYANGIGKLYINGELVQEKSGLSYQWSNIPFVVGIQADMAPVNQWWNAALDGQICGLVLFTRALNAEEIRQLAAQTPPPVSFDRLAKSFRSPVAAEVEKTAEQLVADVEGADAVKRLGAIRTLAQKKADAKPALPGLIRQLQKLIDREGAHLLRSNELVRNALIWALQEIDPADPKARELLGTALAKPMFDSFDLDDPFFDGLRPL
ncbi:MAG: LamG domain-containing protein, partial [Kiritimatiellales bacterium]